MYARSLCSCQLRIHVTRLLLDLYTWLEYHCILENCGRVRMEYMQPCCSRASSRDNTVMVHAVHQVQQPCHRVIWQWQSYTYCMNGVSSVKVIRFLTKLSSPYQNGITWEYGVLPWCESLPSHTVLGKVASTWRLTACLSWENTKSWKHEKCWKDVQ